MPILHWSDNGIASWYDIAVAIGEISAKNGLVNFPALINPVKSVNNTRKANSSRVPQDAFPVYKKVNISNND